MSDLRLSVLDQSPIPSGSTAAQALRDSIRLAQITEELGYHRYWVAEHHGSHSFAGCSPEILVSEIANATSRIRVGAGGVMLMHYSPLKVAENFKLLQCLHPGRIDLGIGRAPGGDAVTTAALAYGKPIGMEYFPAKIADLKAFVRGQPPFTEALAKVYPAPALEVPPEIWMLASTSDGANLAAQFGLPLSFAHFINPDHAVRVCQAYRRAFVPTPDAREPVVNLGVFVICADTEERAHALARGQDVWRVRVKKGQSEAFPSEQEAADYAFTAEEEGQIAARRGRQILGTGEQTADRLNELVTSTGAEEVSVICITHNFDDRVRCYEQLIAARVT
ncbi:MAG: LLM class flavin-dependent oxidoreductase [Gammaproteobacteria bacterium]|nr:LLM class flavin-dependent oxidoreductase [Gammaproteobacteria bacterium]